RGDRPPLPLPAPIEPGGGSIELPDAEIAEGDRPVVPLEQDRPGAIGPVQPGAGAALPEEADVTPVLLPEVDAQLGRLPGILRGQPLEGGPVGLAVADVQVAVHLPA